MRSNLKLIAAASAVALATVATPAAAVDFFPGTIYAGPNGTGSFEVSGNPFAGEVTGSFRRDGVQTGASITDRFIFRLGQDGLGSGSITTSFSGNFGNPTDLDFLSVIFNNGVQNFVVPISLIGKGEQGFLFDVPIFTGNVNILTVTYRSRGNGSYGGQLTFVPFAPVPEPGTWALMLLGFAGMGFMLRRPRKQAVRVKYAF